MKYLLIVMSFSSLVLLGSPQGFPVETQVQISSTPALALAANPNRGYLIMQNNGSGNCQVRFGSAITYGEGIILGAGQNYEPQQSFIKAGVYMKCASAGSSIVFIESNF